MKILEDWKIKISVLWSLLEFCIITVSTVIILGGLYAEETPEMIMVLAITYLIPPIMAFLSLTLKDSINRWLNIIVGIVFIVLMPIGSVDFYTDPIYTAILPSIIVIAIVEVVALALIVWYAWKSKQKA